MPVRLLFPTWVVAGRNSRWAQIKTLSVLQSYSYYVHCAPRALTRFPVLPYKVATFKGALNLLSCMDISDPSPMFQAPVPTADPNDSVNRPPSPVTYYNRPPYLYIIGADPLFRFTRNSNGEIIFPDMAQYTAAPVGPGTVCLLRLPMAADPGSCEKCFLRGCVCTFVVRGEACPPCLAGCLDCGFADRFLFLEALSLFRDTGYARCSLPAEHETFLNRFYSDAKTAFLVFNRHIFRSQTAIASGYATLLRDVSDPTVMNLITILAAALEVSPVIETLLHNQSLELSRDFDSLYAKARDLIDAWKAHQVRD
ncbi:hypothetical protein GGX14DRAFT_408570 [Mycena pura]|uniref:Uncharacterized protein n=1 Tax=Mycena pura TaxID=153505 RepID=A0AAD6Y174_9AGAR|nr:hypothetical protein GGX14DRAFT_408570 [Mycena pura]